MPVTLHCWHVELAVSGELLDGGVGKGSGGVPEGQLRELEQFCFPVRMKPFVSVSLTLFSSVLFLCLTRT